MRSFLNLFGPSPFTALQVHMQIVSRAVHMLEDLFSAMEMNDDTLSASLVGNIQKLEHQADIAKNDIRNHLPKSMFLPIDRNNLLEMLSMQDHIADSADKIATFTAMKKIAIPMSLKGNFKLFLQGCVVTFNVLHQIVSEMGELVEFSFGGVEAEKVKSLVNDVAMREHEAHVLEVSLLKGLLQLEDELPYGTFYLWTHIIEAIAEIAKLSERLANRVRMTLDLE
jgi:predicted phosphate transport protein (TIGR00153 family)